MILCIGAEGNRFRCHFPCISSSIKGEKRPPSPEDDDVIILSDDSPSPPMNGLSHFKELDTDLLMVRLPPPTHKGRSCMSLTAVLLRRTLRQDQIMTWASKDFFFKFRQRKLSHLGYFLTKYHLMVVLAGTCMINYSKINSIALRKTACLALCLLPHLKTPDFSLLPAYCW